MNQIYAALGHLLRHNGSILAGPQRHGQRLWIGGRKLGNSTLDLT
jgi:hypothetical protein